MTVQRQVINLLDHPGLRPVLSCLATNYARWRSGLDVEIYYEGAWGRRMGEYCLAESFTFQWTAAKIGGWKAELRDLLDDYRDWWFYKYRPKERDVILNIGAGIGDDTILFSRSVGKEGKVVSVEAHPETFRLLQKNCLDNLLTNTVPVHCALMDKTSVVQIYDQTRYEANTVRSSNGPPTSSHTVRACTLDELCEQQEVHHVDFLKMNIEGAERFAIQGMQKMLPHISHVCIACHDFIGEHDDFFRTKSMVAGLLQANGFEVTTRQQHPYPWVRDHVHGVRKT
jgi:FkbM family methyltransferase